MTSTAFLEQLAHWDGLGVVVRHDEATGSLILIALHDDSLGTPTGGTRMKVYASPTEALRDAQRLAAGMTAKWAAIDFAFGGGKAVLAIPRPLDASERKGLLRRYAELMAALRGGFWTGPDLGTSAADMAEIAATAPYVHGIDHATGQPLNAGPFTARGVFAAIRATTAVTFGCHNLAGRTVLVEGIGAVGKPLARLLAEAGARLKLADLDATAVQNLARELDAEVVPTAAVSAAECDIYAPCAVGATLNRHTIEMLRCRAVAGSANNQLEDESDAERLLARNILYAPDYVANSGGAIGFGMLGQRATQEEIDQRLDQVEGTLSEIFAEAEANRESPLAAAKRRVERALERARADRRGRVAAAVH